MIPAIPPSPVPEHSLSALPDMAAETVTRLQRNWISTAEQVLGLAATATGRAGLKQLLDCDDPGLDALLAGLAEVVGAEVACRLSQSVPGGETGLWLTEEQQAKVPPTA